MSTLAEVKLWGRTIGAVALEDGTVTSRFEYDPDFARSGIEVAPLMMPLSTQIYSFAALKRETFHGLPGLLADSLPNRFGLDDFKACASIASMKRGRAETIIEEVREVIKCWPEYADDVRVLPEHRDRIQKTLRLEWFD